jgi:FAD:protein FMN transferase
VTSVKIILLALAIVFAAAPASAQLHEVREVHFQMGTYLEVTLWHAEQETAQRLIRTAVQEAHRLDTILSNFRPDSALSQLNRRAGAGSMTVPAELFELLSLSRQLGDKTAGKFDITVGPLMELWQSAAAAKHVPSVWQINQTRALVDYRNLVLSQPNEAALSRSGMNVDLGGIGKGYAVDRMTTIMKAGNAAAALINFGGSSIGAIGAPPGKTAWEIALEDTRGHLRGSIQLRDSTLSTSGSMGHAWTIDGKTYGHLIDPLSGMAATEARMATVITPSATLAEALTKPLVLSGADTMEIVDQFPDTHAIVIGANGALLFSRQFRSRASWKAIHNQ